MEEGDFVAGLGLAFLAHRLRRASDLIVENTTSFVRRSGFEGPARSVSTLLLLNREGPLGVTEIAWRLRLTHPMIIKLSGALAAAGLVEDRSDPADQRRRLIALTEKGRSEAERLETLLPRIADTFAAMFEETGADLLAALEAFEAASERQPIEARLLAAESAPPGHRIIQGEVE